MFLNILVAIDGSEHGAAALRTAAQLAGEEHARLTVVTAVPPTPAYAQLTAAGVAALGDAAQLLGEAGVRMTKQIDELPDESRSRASSSPATPAKVILERLREGRHDLLVMGTRGLGRVGSALLGSVSQARPARGRGAGARRARARALAAAHRPQPAPGDAQQREAVAPPRALAVAVARAAQAGDGARGARRARAS